MRKRTMTNTTVMILGTLAVLASAGRSASAEATNLAERTKATAGSSAMMSDVSWARSQLDLRGEIQNWILKTIDRNTGTRWRGIHDEANFTVSWGDYYLFTGDERVREFLHSLRDAYLVWSKDHEYHGFVKSARDYVTHTFENAEGFVSAMGRMEPEDPVNRDLVLDIAHHLGNWVPEVPAWYDWDKHMLVSHWLGSQEVRNYPPYDFTTNRHARVGQLALTAYRVSGDRRYIDWCHDFVGGWADVILASTSTIPVVRYRTDPSQWPADTPARIRRDYGDPLNSAGIWADAMKQVLVLMIELDKMESRPKYREAIRKAISLLDAAAPGIADTLMERYDRSTGEGRYTDHLAVWRRDKFLPRLAGDPPMPTMVFLENGRGKGFAYRDAEGRIAECRGPGAGDFIVGWKMTGNPAFLKRAMDQARCELKLVARAFREGRDHGCASDEYAHGQGGTAAGVLYPSSGRDRVRYFGGDGKLGLPENVAVVMDPLPPDNEARLIFFNDRDEPTSVGVRAEQKGSRIAEAFVGGEATPVSKDMVTLTLPPRKPVAVGLSIR